MSAITRTNQIHIQTRDRLDSGEGALSFNPIRLEEKLDNDFNFSLKGKVLDVTLIATTIIVVIGLVTSFVALLVGFISFLLGWIIFIPPALTLYCLWMVVLKNSRERT